MTKLLSRHFRCTAFYSCSLIAWPKLSCVYCTGRASGWFFRHEMSDLFSWLWAGVACRGLWCDVKHLQSLMLLNMAIVDGCKC